MSRLLARVGLLIAAGLCLTACGDAPANPAPEQGAAPGQAAPRGAASAEAPAAPASGSRGFASRTGELTNPDATTVVLLYYDLAGLHLPLDDWVENDQRVRAAQANVRASVRETVRAEIEAAAAALREVGRLRITLDARLSDYDPSYQEFTVRALAPSSAVTYDGFGQKVELRFANGLDAQTWPVPAEAAQAIIDRIGPYGRVEADVLLRITGSQPAPRGGTIVTEVVEYELREQRNGHLVGRRAVAGAGRR